MTTTEDGYRKLLEAGEEMEREALALQDAAREGLGEETLPTARIELFEDELRWLLDELNVEDVLSSNGTAASRAVAKLMRALAVEAGDGGRFG